ncbi:hypothetical protein BHE74_00033293 [Ensete ventricosum]|nr:hypothetical protein BHE74_00033293 [Ensete ventricosum]RZS09279.1 hypothetical protein BHM03_00040341 [Ensete ventricosum]
MTPWVVIRISFSLMADSGRGLSTFWYLSMAHGSLLRRREAEPSGRMGSDRLDLLISKLDDDNGKAQSTTSPDTNIALEDLGTTRGRTPPR